MKNKFGYTIVLISVLLASCSTGPDQNGTTQLEGNDTINELSLSNQRLSAVDFNNELTFMQEGILNQVDVLFKSDSTNVDANLENTLFEVELNIESLENMKFPEGGELFRNRMIDLFVFYRTEFTGPFTEIAALLKKETWSKAEEKRIEEYDLNFASQEQALFDSVFVAQENFARANNIKLEVK